VSTSTLPALSSTLGVITTGGGGAGVGVLEGCAGALAEPAPEPGSFTWVCGRSPVAGAWPQAATTVRSAAEAIAPSQGSGDLFTRMKILVSAVRRSALSVPCEVVLSSRPASGRAGGMPSGPPTGIGNPTPGRRRVRARE